MKWIGWAFWGVVIGFNVLAFALIIDLWFGGSSVLYWLWDTRYGVWYLSGASAILGTSFGISVTRSSKNKIPRRVRTGAASHIEIITPPSPCQRVQVKRG